MAPPKKPKTSGEIRGRTGRRDNRAVTPVDDLRSPRKDPRLTMAVAVHHEMPGEQPKGYNVRRAFILVNHEEAWDRRFVLPSEEGWVDILAKYGCWIHKPGHVLIENRTGHLGATNPTEEEKESYASAIVDVYVGNAPPPEDYHGACILPGGCHFADTDGQRTYLRVRASNARLMVFVAPQ